MIPTATAADREEKAMSVYLRLLAERAQSAIETLDAIGDFQSVASRDDAVEISPPGPDGGHR